MKRAVWIVLMLMGIVGSASAQRDDLYFVPKKKKTEVKAEAVTRSEDGQKAVAVQQEQAEEPETTVSTTGLAVNEDAYNRRWSYLAEDGSAVAGVAKDDEGFVLITEEGDTMWTANDTLRLTRVANDEGWVNGFEGSDSDYEYAMRIIRFRNPRYAIPVSSPLYWDVVYGGALWPSWDWNIYDDGLYAYVFPTPSNWYYWDYRMSYPFGWSAWGNPWMHHHGVHWGHHWGGYYGHVWYDPWYNPYFHDYCPGWHVGHHHHHGHYPGFGVGKPGWGGPKAFPNHRTVAGSATRRDTQTGNANRSSASSASRTGTTAGHAGNGATRRIDNGSSRNSSVRVITGSGSSRSSGAVRSSSIRSTGNDEQIRRTTGSSSVSRSTGSSSVSRGTATGSTSRSSYTRQSTSRSSNSGSSYNRPSSTRSSSSSSVSRSSSSSSSRSGSYSGGSSSSSRSSSSYSSGSSSRSSYSGGSSYGGGSSRSSGGSYGGGSSRSSGSRR